MLRIHYLIWMQKFGASEAISFIQIAIVLGVNFVCFSPVNLGLNFVYLKLCLSTELKKINIFVFVFDWEVVCASESKVNSRLKMIKYAFPFFNLSLSVTDLRNSRRKERIPEDIHLILFSRPTLPIKGFRLYIKWPVFGAANLLRIFPAHKTHRRGPHPYCKDKVEQFPGVVSF
jgi:hypothetical protein